MPLSSHRLRLSLPQLPKRPSLKGAAVALILAMHLLGLYLLTLPAPQLQQYAQLAFMTLMPPRPETKAPPLPLPLASTLPTAARTRPKAAPEEQTHTQAAAEAALPAETISVAAEDAPAADSALDFRTRLRQSAGATDRALRAELKKNQPWLAAPEIAEQTQFQKLLSSAYRGGAAVKLEDYILSDGRPGTRVITPSGASCYAMPNNPGAGADPFKTGGKVKKVPCPD